MKAECVSPRSLSSDLSYTRQVFVVDEWLAPPPLLSFLLSSRGASPHLNLSLAPSPRAMWDLSTWLAQAWWRHRSSPTPICSAALDCRHSVQQQRSESAAGFITVGERCRFTSVFIRFYWVFYPAAVSCLDLCPSRPCCFEPLGHHSNGRQVVRAL